MFKEWSFAEKWWCSVESTHLPPMCPGLKSWHRPHMWVRFVDASLHCSETLFSRHSGYPHNVLMAPLSLIPCFFSPQKSTFPFPDSHLTRTGRLRTTLCMCYLHVMIYLLFVNYFLSYAIVLFFLAHCISCPPVGKVSCPSWLFSYKGPIHIMLLLRLPGPWGNFMVNMTLTLSQSWTMGRCIKCHL